MDVNNLGQGEKIAGISAVVLFFVMFIFSWFSIDGVPAGIDSGASAWQAFGFIDIILFITICAAVAVAVMAATATDANLPIAGSAIVAGLGILSVVLILFRIIVTPEPGAFGFSVDTSPSIGAFIGLVAAAGIAYGGWMGMQEEGTSFSDAAGGFQGGSNDPPPPPPPAQ
ncbi:MAG TPA: hypothetical protein VKA36_09335 [Solirubrobacterales bacterium]|nr:hypothetical protein [Solirubrobacterales bacterium]